ncbi:MAG: hypothetical protein ACK2TV_04260 [Anaerolineales bacterium]
MKTKAYQISCTILFGLVLVGLPITSLPLVAQIFGSMVAPFSAIPLAILILIWLIPYLLKGGRLPNEILPILYFALFAIIISAGAFFLDGFYARDRDFFDQSFRAILTILIGLSFYITVSAYIQKKAIIRQALIFLYLGGMVLILWSNFEVFLLLRFGNVGNFPQWVLSFKTIIARQIPGLEFLSRVTGFAYEPSWFGLIFTLIFFPLWLSSVFQRKSLFKWQLWRFQLEDFLLVLSIIPYAYSFPRVGLLAFILMLLYLALLGFIKLYQKIMAWMMEHRSERLQQSVFLRVLIAIILILLVLSIIIGAAVTFVQVASQQDYRFQLIIDQINTENLRNFTFSEEQIITLARRLAFYERTIFWFGGWHIFADYPMGVGLGNAGFYMVNRLNSQGYASFEIRNLIYQSQNLMNTKSLWFRLLSETGIIGFGIYLTWVYLLWRSARFIQKSHDPIMKIVGLAGNLFVLAFIIEGFSVDSFAIPYQWITASLISAGRLVVYKEKITDEPDKIQQTTSNIADV